MREKARAEGRPPRYDGRWRDRDPSEAPPGVKPVDPPARRRSEGETVIDDKVQGRVAWANKDLDDLVLLRSDGTPTYMLAVVVDDHDMGVTHIIRGDDHLTNAARQTQIYQALGWSVPVMAHIPLIHGAGRRQTLEAPWRARRRRLSRHGLPARGAAQLSGAARLEPRRQGILLDRGDDRRVRSRVRSAARRRASTSPSSRTSTATICARAGDEELLRRSIGALPYLPGGAGGRGQTRRRMRAKLSRAMPGLKERAKTLVELVRWRGFPVRGAAACPRREGRRAFSTRADGRSRRDCSPRLAALADWTAASTEAVVRDLCRRRRRKARHRRAAVARRAHRPVDLAGNFRCARSIRQGRKPRPPARPGGVRRVLFAIRIARKLAKAYLAEH